MFRLSQMALEVITLPLCSKMKGKVIFAEHTTENVGQFLAIVLDKKVISVPRINSAIPDGAGVIQGDFTIESANNLAIQLAIWLSTYPLQSCGKSCDWPHLR